MARVTSNGVEPTPLDSWIEFFGDLLQRTFGPGLSLAPDTQEGQLAVSLAIAYAAQDEVIAALANMHSLHHSAGRQLHDLGTQVGIDYLDATRTTAELTVGGSDGTVVPAGSLAGSDAGVLFETTEAVTIGSSGSSTVDAQCVVFGEVEVAASTLTRILSRVTGWDTVTNEDAGTTGREAETDAAFRLRYLSTIGGTLGTLEHIKAQALQLSSITRIEVTSNDTASAVTWRGLTVDANSILVSCDVDESQDDELGKIISNTKPTGIPTSGAQSVTVDGRDINFQRASEQAIAVSASISIRPEFPSNGVSQIKDALVNHVKAKGLGVDFETNELLAPFYSVIGHTVSTHALTLENGNSLGTIDADQFWALDAADVTVTVT